MAKDDNSVKVVCANPDCRIAETGKCVEGLETNKCPHFGRNSPAADKENFDGVNSSNSNAIRLPGSDPLTIEEATKLLCARDARIIAIVGPRDAGKTTLIASLYELFQEGPVLGIEFARSLTLQAFERVCHDARAVSRRNEPQSIRTPLGQVRFYHLDFAGGPAGGGLAIALGDRAGEEYLNATNDTSIVDTFPEVRRANTLTLLVDGARLLDEGARHNLRSNLIMILQAFVDGGTIRKGTRLAIVLTKFDLVQDSPDQARAKTDFSLLLTKLKQLFHQTFSVIQEFKTAASPKDTKLKRGTGVAELLSFWLTPAMEMPMPPLPQPTYTRAFSRLKPIQAQENVK